MIQADKRKWGGSYHKVIGSALGYASEMEETRMRCSACNALQDELLESDAPMRQQLAQVVCLFCSRIGTMRLAR